MKFPHGLVHVSESPDPILQAAKGGWVALGKTKPFREASPWDRGRLARIGSAQQSAVAPGVLLAFLILRGPQSRQDAGAPAYRGSRQTAFQIAKIGNRVVPVDNFLIYKNIIRLDRPN